MGETENAISEIEKVSETKPNILNAKGIIIATITTFVDVKELTAWFTLNNRSFLVFDLDPENSGVFITNKKVYDGLFGFINKQSKNNDLINKTNDLLSEITTNMIEETQDIEGDISEMSEKEKENMLNQIMDKGVVNMTDYDKKIMVYLTK
jgi:hypothetical protein